METQNEEGNIKKSSNGKNNTMIRVLIVVIIVLVLALVYVFAFQDQKEQNQVNSNLATSNQNSNAEVNDNRPDFKTTNSQEGDVSGESQTKEAEKSPEAVLRDEQRVADIKKIQDALAKFKSDKGNYPEKIEELVPTYLSEIPKNPAPGGIDYVYTPIGKLPAEYYDLAYELEAGTDEIKDAGTHIANPESIANP